MVYKIYATTKEDCLPRWDVLNINIAYFIYNSIGREEIADVQWDYVSLPTPWNPKGWAYAML